MLLHSGREVASQARRRDQADAVIREAIELRAALAALSERVHRATPVAVAELRAAGLTVRDVARLLGVTASRVSQIEQRGRGGAEGTRPVG